MFKIISFTKRQFKFQDLLTCTSEYNVNQAMILIAIVQVVVIFIFITINIYLVLSPFCKSKSRQQSLRMASHYNSAFFTGRRTNSEQTNQSLENSTSKRNLEISPTDQRKENQQIVMSRIDGGSYIHHTSVNSTQDSIIGCYKRN